ncbi:P-loop ATPase, Sll1717 family [Bradyrhizobium liaoningense]|uniref:P-loop ATPase, Sll1717 family n=1 Tax=Bradyrhizobium liaoningense TaxID=43992 RepID=UPI001BA7C57B|nr:hypothetical protein [Bradyrhizobium liaoningense]MBR1070496.1 hypothetical protein [Bradyrhizobium liaoningense]
MPIPIDDLKFPYADAAEIHEADDKRLFATLFSVPQHIDRLIKSPIYFIIGEKGTGKTAIATYVSNALNPQLSGATVKVEKEDYDNFKSFNSSVPLTFADYSEIWETSLLLLLSANLIEALEPSYRETLQYANSVAAVLGRVNYGASVARLAESFDLLCWNRPALFEALAKEFPDRITGEIPVHFRTYVRVVKSILVLALNDVGLSRNSPNSKYLLFIDGVDTRPLMTGSSEGGITHEFQFSCLAGLIASVQRLNTQILRRNFGHNVRVVLLVRPDIMEKVNLHNAANIMNDNSILINWYTANHDYETSEFFKLADYMLLQQQPNRELYPMVGDCWRAYFPDSGLTFGDKIRDAFVVFLQHSFYRPRDLVFFLRSIRDRMDALERGGATKFDLHLFTRQNAMGNYSNYLLNEIKDSTLFYHDETAFDLLVRLFSILHDDIKDGAFSYSNFVGAYNELRRESDPQLLMNSPIFSSADDFLQFLYEFNVIGFRMPPRDTGIFSFCYQRRSASMIRPRVRTKTEYRIHHGVGRALYPKGIP